MARKKMTETEKNQWESLYYYVKKNIMNYDDNQALPSKMVLRLKGLTNNKFIENKNIKDTANYSYEIILNTFKYCFGDISRVLKTKDFKDEWHKFLYITKIVENNINDVYIKMKNIKVAKEEATKVEIEIPTHIGAEYKPRENKKDKFKDLW